ncbi:MAG: Hsp20/alpha crystallin family protein [Anaerolineales bacterium]|jgi:HSP20 family molecular chaperone IbpA
MAKKEKDEKALMKAPEQEVVAKEDMERTRERQCFIPKADIYELEGNIIIVADVPGANQDSVEITLDKNVLTIEAFVDPDIPEGYSLAWGEYEIGDYQRSFRLSSEIDREKIEAMVANGQLRLQLPKAEEAKAKKITVKAG